MADAEPPLSNQEFQMLTGAVSLAAVFSQVLGKANAELHGQLQIEAAVEYGKLNQAGDKVAAIALGMFLSRLHRQQESGFA